MSFKFQRETYHEVIKDITPLLTEHYEELALYAGAIVLDPDFDFYQMCEKIGILAIYTARENGVLIGYAIYFVRKHHHYRQHTWAISDIILVQKQHRNYGVASGLFDTLEADMRLNKVDVLHTTTKNAHPELAYFLSLRGHELEGQSFSKRL